jgi:cytoskeletal protein CcmA (bactofilin family)
MGMFGKSATIDERQSTQEIKNKTKKDAPSIISAGLSIVGNMTSDGEVHVDGVVNGDIMADDLTIGPDAQVTGHIEADVALIRGQVNGIIRARSVTLAKTARVIGDIVHENLAIETGALMEGHCRRLNKENAEAPTKAPNKFRQRLETEDMISNSEIETAAAQ